MSRRFFDVNLAESSREQIGKINQQKKLLEEVNPRESQTRLSPPGQRISVDRSKDLALSTSPSTMASRWLCTVIRRRITKPYCKSYVARDNEFSSTIVFSFGQIV